MKWIELFINLMREGLGDPLSLEFILPHAGGEERTEIIREIDSVALYHYKLKLAHEDKIRKRFGRTANANMRVEDQEEAAAQEFMADIVRDMQFSDVVRGDAGELVAVNSESSSEYESDGTDEPDSSEEDSGSSETGTAESAVSREPPRSAPPARQHAASNKGRSSLEVPSPSKGPKSGSGHARSFSHDTPSPVKRDPSGGRKPLRSSPAPIARRRKAPVNLLKEPELKLLPELLPLFVELVSSIMHCVVKIAQCFVSGATNAPAPCCLIYVSCVRISFLFFFYWSVCILSRANNLNPCTFHPVTPIVLTYFLDPCSPILHTSHLSWCKGLNKAFHEVHK